MQDRGINSNLYRVEYSENLPEFESKKNINPIDILTRKTQHWRFESEYRIINTEDYYFIKKGINSILLAPNIDNECLELLIRMLPWKIPIFSTKLNMEEIKIEIDEKLL